MTRTALALAAVAALAACSGGQARRGERPGDDMVGPAYRQSVFLSGAALLFVQFDADNDYTTTRAEVQNGIDGEWRRASGGATVLSPIQFATWSARALGGPNLGPYRLAFDTNVNNEITQQEFTAAILERFDRYDADKDGVLRRADMTERLPEPQRRPESAGQPAGQPRR